MREPAILDVGSGIGESWDRKSLAIFKNPVAHETWPEWAGVVRLKAGQADRAAWQEADGCMFCSITTVQSELAIFALMMEMIPRCRANLVNLAVEYD